MHFQYFFLLFIGAFGFSIWYTSVDAVLFLFFFRSVDLDARNRSRYCLLIYGFGAMLQLLFQIGGGSGCVCVCACALCMANLKTALINSATMTYFAYVRWKHFTRAPIEPCINYIWKMRAFFVFLLSLGSDCFRQTIEFNLPNKICAVTRSTSTRQSQIYLYFLGTESL